MNRSYLNRYAFSRLTIAAILCGCGGSQPPIGAPGTIPPTSAYATRAERGRSWMLPEATGEDLLYVDSRYTGEVYAYGYPSGRLIGILKGFSRPQGLCSDAKGDVWITTDVGGSYSSGKIFEYAHGGKERIATLDDSGNSPRACSVSPTTGDLAVANYSSQNGRGDGNLAIYAHARGTPKLYGPDGVEPFSCSYDDKGDVFVAGQTGVYTADVVWLPKDSPRVQKFRLRPHVYAHYGVQWDGEHLAVAFRDDHLYQYTVAGSTGEQVGETEITHDFANFWIQGSTILGTSLQHVEFWPYPSGGRHTKIILGPKHAASLSGVTVSLTPK
ncbi:MAG: hypothetical protein WA814_06610 [Candidatus Baltobacteraceae bacterium]